MRCHWDSPGRPVRDAGGVQSRRRGSRGWGHRRGCARCGGGHHRRSERVSSARRVAGVGVHQVINCRTPPDSALLTTPGSNGSEIDKKKSSSLVNAALRFASRFCSAAISIWVGFGAPMRLRRRLPRHLVAKSAQLHTCPPRSRVQIVALHSRLDDVFLVKRIDAVLDIHSRSWRAG